MSSPVRPPEPVTAERPTYGSVLWALVPAWIATAILLAVSGAGLLALADAEPLAQRFGPPWVFPLDEPSGWLANAPLALLGLALLTVLTRLVLPRGPDGERVAVWPLAAVLAVTGAFATIPRGDEGQGGVGLLGWLVAAWLIRRLPRRPDDAPVRPVSRRAVRLAAVGAGVLALLPLSMSYADRHPLVVQSASCIGKEGGDCVLRQGSRFGVPVSVRNAGDETVRVTRVGLVGLPDGFRVERVRDVGYADDLRLPREIAADRSLDVDFRVRVPRGGCDLLYDEPLATAIELTTPQRTQRLALEPGALELVECVGP